MAGVAQVEQDVADDGNEPQDGVDDDDDDNNDDDDNQDDESVYNECDCIYMSMMRDLMTE